MAGLEGQVLQEIRDINRILREARALNGWFETLVNTIDEIKDKVGALEDKLTDLNTSLYQPDSGLYARVKDTETTQELSKTKLQELQEDYDLLSGSVAVVTRLQAIAGKDLDDLGVVVKLKQNFSKMYWVLVAAATTSVGKILFDALTGR